PAAGGRRVRGDRAGRGRRPGDGRGRGRVAAGAVAPHREARGSRRGGAGPPTPGFRSRPGRCDTSPGGRWIGRGEVRHLPTWRETTDRGGATPPLVRGRYRPGRCDTSPGDTTLPTREVRHLPR